MLLIFQVTSHVEHLSLNDAHSHHWPRFTQLRKKTKKQCWSSGSVQDVECFIFYTCGLVLYRLDALLQDLNRMLDCVHANTHRRACRWTCLPAHQYSNINLAEVTFWVRHCQKTALYPHLDHNKIIYRVSNKRIRSMLILIWNTLNAINLPTGPNVLVYSCCARGCSISLASTCHFLMNSFFSGEHVKGAECCQPILTPRSQRNNASQCKSDKKRMLISSDGMWDGEEENQNKAPGHWCHDAFTTSSGQNMLINNIWYSHSCSVFKHLI